MARLLEIEEHKVTKPTGKVDFLMGLDYADFHPQRVRAVLHLVLFRGPFGYCLGGRHELCEGEEAAGLHLTQVETSTDQFLTVESEGVSCHPRCGGCKCGKCPLRAQPYTLQEERELDLIDKGLEFVDGRWIAKYPWVRDPRQLPDNKAVVEAKLKSLEERLSKDKQKAKMYNDQIHDMVERAVARVISVAELIEYKGPVHYIAHHAVLKPESNSTPMRIVFNSSAS